MNLKNIDKDSLLSDIASGMSRRELAQKYNCSNGTLLSHIRKYIPDFKFKPNKSDVLTKEFLENSILSVTEISKTYDISMGTIFKYIKSHNIEYTKNKKAIILLKNKSWLYDQYITQNKSLIQIEKELNSSRKTIKIYLKLHNIPLKERYKERLSTEALNLSEEKTISLYVDNKLSTEEISLIFNCNPEYIRQILIKNNIGRRSGGTTSSHERFIQSILQDLNVKYIQNTKKIISPYELDIFVPNYNIAFEVNGVYFHSNKFIDKDYHEKKRLLCENKNIRLIQLFEDDLIYRKTIIEKFIRNIFNRSEYIPARKCKIIENVDISVKKSFMNENHIQGYAKSNYSIGLVYENQLIALMLFDNNILTRYATAKNVQGGFSRLLKNCKFNIVKTFVDLSMFSGAMYFKCGFLLDKYVPPDYKYVINNKRIHKFNYRKDRFKTDENLKYEENLSESELAKLNNINKIYDAGKLRLIWQR